MAQITLTKPKVSSTYILEVIKRKQQQQQEQREKLRAPPKKVSSTIILERINERRWLYQEEMTLRTFIANQRAEYELIQRLPKLRRLMVEMMLDVERYMGSRMGFWWINLEFNESIEEQWPEAPKLKDFHVGNYWEQLAYYQKHGTAEVPGENTKEFILARGKWVGKQIGETIHIAREQLRVLKNWKFTEEDKDKYFEVNQKFYQYDGCMIPL
jgi:hypothetical protein